VHEQGERPANAGTDVTTAGAVFLPFAAETDPAKLRASLEKKLDKVQKGVGGIEKKLSNERFLQNADPDVVASEKERLVELQQEAGMLTANLAAL